MPFTFEKLENGAVLITPKIFKDSRGFFFESYKQSDFKMAGIDKPFVQDNQSFSVKDVIRGIHYQKYPKPQGKLVRCIKGAIIDIAVDLQGGSPTFKQIAKVELTEENKKMLWIPEGYGHAFLSLSEFVEIHYKCTEEFDGSLDAGIRWDDPELNISWECSNVPVISDKDRILPLLRDAILFQ